MANDFVVITLGGFESICGNSYGEKIVGINQLSLPLSGLRWK